MIRHREYGGSNYDLFALFPSRDSKNQMSIFKCQIKSKISIERHERSLTIELCAWNLFVICIWSFIIFG
jgi:hypothetical protein